MDEQAQSVSNCYVFKSRLQEYAQKAGLTTPVYHTIKEGPSHQPLFKSTVVINNESYHSLTGFLNRKAAEQSAAEVALIEIAKSGATDKSVSHPVHETGLCKNLLQEYAQKMNYAIPSYICTKDEKKGRESSFSCTVDIGGIKYMGTSAKTKKEAKLKAAKTALLAIQMSTPEPKEKPDTPDTESLYTVVPTKRKMPERAIVETDEKVKPNKRKKSRFPKRRKKKVQRTGGGDVEVKTEDPSSGEVKELTSNVGEVKDLASNGGEVKELASNGGEVKELASNEGEVKELASSVGVVKDLASSVGVVKDLTSNESEVKDLTWNGGEVKDLTWNGGEVKDLTSNGGVVNDLASNGGEVKDFTSNGESILVPCGNLGGDGSSVFE